MESHNFFARAKLLNLPQLCRDRPDWSDRLPPLFSRPIPAHKDLVTRKWSHYVPTPAREAYGIWRMNRRHRRNLEQIDIDELDEIVDQSMEDDSSELMRAIYDKHEQRRIQSR